MSIHDVSDNIVHGIQAQLGPDNIASARLLPVAEPSPTEKKEKAKRGSCHR